MLATLVAIFLRQTSLRRVDAFLPGLATALSAGGAIWLSRSEIEERNVLLFTGGAALVVAFAALFGSLRAR